MKVGITTFHRAVNHGAFLQAFALRTVLEGLGHTAFFVDYWPRSHSGAYGLFRKEQADSPKNFILELYLAGCRALKYIIFKRALRRYLGVSGPVLFRSAPDLESLDADCIIYGSDQIWWKDRLAGDCGFDSVYWGDAVRKDIPKIAYAPSMGIMDISEDDRVFIRGHLGNFRSLSVREDALASLLEDISGKEVSVTLDPVLLLPVSSWRKYCKGKDRRYVLLYTLAERPDLLEAAGRESRDRGVELVILKGGTGSWKHLGMTSLLASPFDFVSLVAGAEYVITDSFHGTAFSIIFNRPFTSLPAASNSGRVTSLLGRLGISDSSNVNWEEVNARLERLRDGSLSYLKNALGYGKSDILH